MLGFAEKLLYALAPLLFDAISDALRKGECPLAAQRRVLDGEEAAAILAELVKFRDVK